MPREVQDSENVIWSCVEAYAGLKQKNEEKSAAAKVEGANDLVYVVCTPSGGEQTLRLQLKSDWEESLSDEDLLREIEANKNS